jgi:hypothetical protein
MKARIFLVFCIAFANIACNGLSNAVSGLNGYSLNLQLEGQESFFSSDSTFVYDDGTGENGWYINPDLVNWLGNYCPVGNTTGGVLKSVEVFFMKNESGENFKLSVDIFSTGNVLLGSSAQFTAVSGSWIPVTLPDVPFLGPFYVMVKWNKVEGWSHFLGMDNNGTFASQDLERYYDGTSFQKLSEIGVSDPGVFMIHVKAVIDPAAGVDDLLTDNFSVYPNPVKDYLNILSTEALKEVKITDLSGKVVLATATGDTREMKMDLSALPNGFYCVILSTREGNSVRKISVIR